MNYPTLKEVNSASLKQLCRWTRFLPSPGVSAIGTDKFEGLLRDEVEIMDVILRRQRSLGGWTPELSKGVGWQ